MPFDVWHTSMSKLLNLTTDSFCLNNLNDLKESWANDIDDLTLNFSLAYKILQSKYQLEHLQLMPELEGIPGTFYEYTVKYNQQMERYY